MASPFTPPTVPVSAAPLVVDLAELADPGADRLMFWDDSAGILTWLTAGTGLTVSGTTIAAAASPTEHAYVEFTANVTASATSAATSTDVVSAGAVVFDGATRVKIEFYSESVEPGSAIGAGVILNLFDATTDLGRIAHVQVPVAGALDTSVYVCRYLTPSAASHTYKITCWRTGANGLVRGGGGGTDTVLPGFIRITTA